MSDCPEISKPTQKRKTPFLTTSVGQDLILTILLIPLWWILGVRFFVFHLIAFWIFLRVVFKKYKEKDRLAFPAEAMFCTAFIILYFLSLLINLKNIPSPRVLASLNNLSFWVMGLLVILAVHNSLSRENMLSLLKAFSAFGLLSSLFVATAYIVWFITHKYIHIKSALYYLLPERMITLIMEKAPLVKYSILPTLIGWDKLFRRDFPRTPAFNLYGTALGATMVFLIAMTLAYYTMTKRRRLLIVVLVLEFGALIMSLSRMSVMALILSALIVTSITRLNKPSSRIVLAVVLIGIILVLILFPPQRIVRTFSDFRKGSTVWRAHLYRTTLSQSLKKPILGHGYKPRTEGTPVPIGSHSTYLGVIYKTGFLGFAAFLLFWLAVLRRWWLGRRQAQEDSFLHPLWFYTGIALFGGFFWMITEDLDAPPAVAFIYFILIGLICTFSRWQREDKV